MSLPFVELACPWSNGPRAKRETIFESSEAAEVADRDDKWDVSEWRECADIAEPSDRDDPIEAIEDECEIAETSDFSDSQSELSVDSSRTFRRLFFLSFLAMGFDGA